MKYYALDNQLNPFEFQVIVGNIKVPFGWKLLLRFDDHRPYLQVESTDGVDNFTGDPLPWRGRKWMLSPHMCVSEVVRTAYLAVKQAAEHELNENFQYKGAAIFDPHWNVDLLVEMSSDKRAIDSRNHRTAKL